MPPCVVGKRPGSTQNQRAEAVHELGGKTVVLYQETHVDRAIEGVQEQILIDIFAQLAATNATLQCGIGFPSPRPKEALTERSDQIFVALSRSQDGRNDAAVAAPEDLRYLAHLPAHVGVNRAGIRKAQSARGAAGKSVGDESTFIRPPAVDGGFAYPGATSHCFNGKVGKSILTQKSERALKNCAPSFFAAWAPGRPFPAAVFTG